MEAPRNPEGALHDIPLDGADFAPVSSSSADSCGAASQVAQHPADLADSTIAVRSPYRRGDLVRAHDFDNQGEVVLVEPGRVLVHFVNKKTGNTSDVFFTPAELSLIHRKGGENDFQILTLKQLLGLPRPGWLIDGMLRPGELAVLYGQPGSGKTFVALDIGMCVTTGRFWCDRATRIGRVLYIAAEGLTGLGDRSRAWAVENIPDPEADPWTNFNVLGEPVQFLEGGVENLLSVLALLPWKPVLIIVDTLARCFVGGEENSSKDMGRFVAACDQLRNETGATVLVVHHTAKDKSSERGSSALRGAADAMFEVASPEPRKVTVRCTKQKEGEMDRERVFNLRVLTVDIEEGGKAVTSCRLELVKLETPIGSSPPGATTDELTSDAAILKAMRDSFFEDGASGSALIAACGVPKQTVYRRLKVLVERGDLVREAAGRSARYRLPNNAAGAQVPVPVSPVSPCPTETTTASRPCLSHPPPLKGGPGTETETNGTEEGSRDV